MRRSSSLVVGVFILLFSVTAQAQQYERFRLPEGQRIVYEDETYQAFNLGEYQQLLRMDADLRHLTVLVATQREQVTELSTAVTELREALALADDAYVLLEADRDRLYDLWVVENQKRHEAENKPSWDWIPWTLAAAFAITSVVLGVVVGVM